MSAGEQAFLDTAYVDLVSLDDRRTNLQPDQSLTVALRLQDSAALTLIALELRALRQSFESGEEPWSPSDCTSPETKP